MMPITKRLACHLSLAGLALLAAPGAAAQTADNTGPATFAVFFRGSQVGTERVILSRRAGGWQISSDGTLAPPFDLITTKFELSYGADWQPQQLAIEGRLRGENLSLTTTFGVTTASNEAVQRGERASSTHQISARSVILPNSFFGAYEALAARLSSMAPGSQIPVYVAPDSEVRATVDRITPRRVVSPDGAMDLREFSLTFTGQAGPVPLEIWVDSRQRLARLTLPASAVVVLRSDLASVMVREEVVHNPGDEPVLIPANGFSLAGTLTKPTATTGKVPAVILASSPGPQGRDYLTYGVPIFGQLAGTIAEAGYLVVRYDGRGVGQSGGRTETAGISEYADDVIAVVQWLRRRADVDEDRIAVVGYGEGGPIAMMAASREKRIKGVALVASPGRTGRDVTIEQQQLLLTDLSISESEKAARRALQARVNQATISGRGWDGIPADLRRQAETAWFRSWLQFDPADAIKRLNQPILIVHGERDREVPRAHADRLEELSATMRKRPASHTRKVVIPGLNHLLVTAGSGDASDYDTLPSRVVSTEVTRALLTWLPGVWTGR